MKTRAQGELGERIAAAFLALKGYELIDRNVRFARREIDLVAREGEWVVAVEVKMRRGRRFGSAAQAIDRRKIDRIRVALTGWMRDSRCSLEPRIDVVAIDMADGGDRMVVEHYVGVS